jgi:hypothetical protein
VTFTMLDIISLYIPLDFVSIWLGRTWSMEDIFFLDGQFSSLLFFVDMLHVLRPQSRVYISSIRMN